MSPEKLMKIVEELLLYPPGPDRTLLEQMRPEDRLKRTQFMLHDSVRTACEQVSEGLSITKMLQKINEAYKDYVDTLAVLAAAENWERERLVQLKSEAMEGVRSAKADLKRMEKELRAALRSGSWSGRPQHCPGWTRTPPTLIASRTATGWRRSPPS